MDYADFLNHFFVGTQSVSWWGTILENMTPPQDFSTSGHLIDSLFNYTTVMNIFYFILVAIGIFVFPFIYHWKRNKKPYYTYGNKKIHLLVTAGIGLAVFFTIDLNITRLSNNDLLSTFWNFPGKEKDVVKIEVLAQQWMWHFRYAGEDGEFNTKDDILTAHEMHIPKNKKILIHMTSKDVIHSFFLPNARLKVDAIPGRVTRLWFDYTKSGEFDIACAEMCGIHHYLMKAKLVVHEEEEFLAWKTEAQKIALTEFDENNPDIFWGWKWNSRK